MPKAFDAILTVMKERFYALDTKMPEKARDADECPAALLGHLGWSRGLDYWGDWTEEQKRALIKSTPANLRIRGTRAAINAAVAAFATELTLEEWFEQSPEGDPGTARATVESGSFVESDPEALQTILDLLEREGRKSIHWTLIVAIAGTDAIGDEARGRVASLYQYTGAQTGA